MTSHDGLQVLSVSKGYGSNSLLDDVTFDVEPGEVVCLTGDNGAGKSTLLKCIVGLVRYKGLVALGGKVLDGKSDLAEVGYVPQSPALVETATVGETLSFFASLRGFGFDEGSVPDGFLPAFDVKISHLSGGQRQRVALAIGFLGAPKLLLLDEPTANLDDKGRLLTRSMMKAAAARGTSVVIVSPAAIDLASVVDRVLVLNGGRVKRGASIERLLRAEQASATDTPRERLELVEASS